MAYRIAIIQERYDGGVEVVKRDKLDGLDVGGW